MCEHRSIWIRVGWVCVIRLRKAYTAQYFCVRSQDQSIFWLIECIHWYFISYINCSSICRASYYYLQNFALRNCCFAYSPYKCLMVLRGFFCSQMHVYWICVVWPEILELGPTANNSNWRGSLTNWKQQLLKPTRGNFTCHFYNFRNFKIAFVSILVMLTTKMYDTQNIQISGILPIRCCNVTDEISAHIT